MARFFEVCTPRWEMQLARMKTELFQGLKQQKQKGQRLRILEIGPGCGSNLIYFPQGVDLVVVEPNDAFREALQRNLAKYPGIRLIRNYVAFAEDMADIGSGSVDIVVTSSVHCSVRDIRKVLEEIERVLVPGGKYYFIEHCLDPSPSTCRTVQRFLTWTGIWGFYFGGCEFRNIQKAFEESSSFRDSLHAKIGYHDHEMDSYPNHIVAAQYYGIATKN